MDDKQIENRFEETYRPLVDAFVEKLAKHPVSDYRGIPHPFFPAWGKNYGYSLVRIAIIGKETRGWNPNLDDFITAWMTRKYDLNADREEFQNLDFKDSSWMGNVPTKSSFWGFWMNVLAKTYGVESWEEIKDGKFDVLLDSFLWGNVNSIETPTSVTHPQDAPGYDLAKKESTTFDSVSLLTQVFAPDVIILTCAQDEMRRYLDNSYEEIETFDDNRIKIMRKGELLILHTPHPNRQRWYPDGAERFALDIRDLLKKYGKFCPLPKSSSEGLTSKSKEILIHQCSAEKMDKYEAIACIAHELRKQHTTINVPQLIAILNQAGHRTDWGEEFTGGRGSYQLCSAAYRRFESHNSNIAEDIALAFTTSDGQYAYEK